MKKRELHIEVLRIIAAFFVIFNHTQGFSLFNNYSPDSKSYWVFLAITAFSKISVPLFFMISGALLLQKEYEKPKKIFYRFLRILITLVIFSFLSYLQQIHLGAETFDLLHFFNILVKADWLNAYWYLYMYMAFLLCLPFLRAMAKNLRSCHYLYLIAIYLLFHGIIPIVFRMIFDWDFAINSNFTFGWLLGQVPLYPLIGHYLENKLDINRISWKILVPLWLVNILCIFLTCYATYVDNTASGGFTQNYIMSFVLVPCVTLYISAKKLFHRVTGKWISTILTSVGGCTFGIYLIHGQLLREPRARIFSQIFRSPELHSMIWYILICLDVMLIAFVFIWLLRRIPFMRKLL